jgi:signal peptidase II
LTDHTSSSSSSKRRSAAAVGATAAILAVLVLTADQLAKLAVIRNLPYETPVRVLGDFLIFYYVRNPGAAFSLGESVTWIFTIALALVAVTIVWLLITRVRSRAWAITLGLLLGGVLGNLSDRLFRSPSFGIGHVVDFISTPWMMPAIYNIADMFIVCCMITVALLVLLGVHMDGSRERGRKKDDETLLGADGDEFPPGGPVEGFGDQFPVADPDAGIPASERRLPPLTRAERREAEREAERAAERRDDEA